MGRYLDGVQARFRTASDRRSLIGKRVCYLLSSGIDRSGRGYIFPRHGLVTHTSGKNIYIDDNPEYVSNIVEMVFVPEDDT